MSIFDQIASLGSNFDPIGSYQQGLQFRNQQILQQFQMSQMQNAIKQKELLGQLTNQLSIAAPEARQGILAQMAAAGDADTASAINNIYKPNLVEVADSSSPSGARYVSAYEAGGMPAYSRNGQNSPSYTSVPGSNGYYILDHRTGNMKLATDQGGRPIVPFQASPEANAAVTSAKEGAKVRSEAQAQAQVSLPQVVAGAQQSMDLIDKALNHPGRSTATGMSGSVDPRNYLPGTDAKNFRVLLDQIKGRTFLEAFNSLRGGGQITEVEGKKATDALGRLNTAQSDEEFASSLKDLKDVLASGIERARSKAAGAGTNAQPASNSGGVQFLGFE